MFTKHPKGITKSINRKPTSRAVLFCQEFINLTSIAAKSGISLSMLSKIFSGRRRPSIVASQKIAAALGMSTGAFIRALIEHQDTLAKYSPRQVAPIPKQEVPAQS